MKLPQQLERINRLRVLKVQAAQQRVNTATAYQRSAGRNRLEAQHHLVAQRAHNSRLRTQHWSRFSDGLSPAIALELNEIDCRQRDESALQALNNAIETESAALEAVIRCRADLGEANRALEKTAWARAVVRQQGVRKLVAAEDDVADESAVGHGGADRGLA